MVLYSHHISLVLAAGRAPGKTVDGVLLDNVTIIIDKVPSWNYSASSVPAVLPNIEFDPSDVVSPTREFQTSVHQF